MTSIRENIKATLIEAGLPDLSVEDVIAEFKSSDELAPYLAGADDVEAAVFAHLPSYLALRGVLPDVGGGGSDPTQTQPTPPSLPTPITSAQTAAITAALSSKAEMQAIGSAQSEIVAVLIDKPYPGEWMKDLKPLQVKGEPEKVIKDMKARYTPDVDVNTLLQKVNSTFIPSTAQLAELKTLHQNAHKEAKTTPMWFDFDNTTAYENILRTLTDGNATFTVLIAPKEDEGEGAYKNKAWRWNTKGYAVKHPVVTSTGATQIEESNFSKNSLLGYVAVNTLGYIPSRRENGLGCVIATVKKKNTSGSGASATSQVSQLRVKGNNPAGKPELRVINTKGNGVTKMVVRSEAFYFVVRVASNGTWSVRKQRLALQWEDAPVWELKTEYENVAKRKIKGGVSRPDAKTLQSIQEASIALVADILSKGAQTAMVEYGINDFCREVEEQVNKQSAEAAAALSL